MLYWLKCAALISLAFVLIVMGVEILRIAPKISMAAISLDQFTGSLIAPVDNLNAAIEDIHRPCGTMKPCGTLADVAKTLHTIRGAVGQIEIAARHEDQRIGILDAQEATIYADTHKSLKQLNEDLATANQTIADLQPVEANLSLEAEQLKKATGSLNTLISNPDIPAALKNANSAIGHADATVADVQQAVHKALHPTWPTKVLHGVEDVGHFVFAIVF